MVSTGSIDLIKDQALRKTAVVLFTTPLFDEITGEGKAAEYRQIFRRLVSKDVQHALLERCGDRFIQPLDYERIVKSLDYRCTLNLPAEKISAAAKSLRSQEKLASALQLRFADVETALADLQINNPTVKKNLRNIAGGQK